MAKCYCLLSGGGFFWVEQFIIQIYDSSSTLLSILLESPHKDKEMSDIGIDRSPSKKLYCQRERERSFTLGERRS